MHEHAKSRSKTSIFFRRGHFHGLIAIMRIAGDALSGVLLYRAKIVSIGLCIVRHVFKFSTGYGMATASKALYHRVICEDTMDSGSAIQTYRFLDLGFFATLHSTCNQHNTVLSDIDIINFTQLIIKKCMFFKKKKKNFWQVRSFLVKFEMGSRLKREK